MRTQEGGETSGVDTGASRAKPWGVSAPDAPPRGSAATPEGKASRPRRFASPRRLLRHHRASCVITSPNVRAPRSFITAPPPSPQPLVTSLASPQRLATVMAPELSRLLLLRFGAADVTTATPASSRQRSRHHSGDAGVTAAGTLTASWTALLAASIATVVPTSSRCLLRHHGWSCPRYHSGAGSPRRRLRHRGGDTSHYGMPTSPPRASAPSRPRLHHRGG